MARVIFDNVTKRYGGNPVPAVNDLSMEVEDQEFLVLVGPSGCGKSTAMRMVAGLEEITEGRIIIGDRVVNDLPPKDRDVAMVFQCYALYPHMTVRDNLAYPLKLRKVPQGRARAAGARGGADPGHRAVPRPQAEGALRRSAPARGLGPGDRPQRRRLPDGRAALQPRRQAAGADAGGADQAARAGQTTTIYVTHDQVEAMTMGDRIAVMSLGVLQQLDTPQNLYDHPANKFVAGFIGSPSMNFLDVAMQAGEGRIYAVTPGFRMRVPDAEGTGAGGYIGQNVTLGVRPEHLIERSRLDGTAPPDSMIPVTVDIVEMLGNELFVYLTNGGVYADRADGTGPEPDSAASRSRSPPPPTSCTSSTPRPRTWSPSDRPDSHDRWTKVRGRSLVALSTGRPPGAWKKSQPTNSSSSMPSPIEASFPTSNRSYCSVVWPSGPRTWQNTTGTPYPLGMTSLSRA